MKKFTLLASCILSILTVCGCQTDSGASEQTALPQAPVVPAVSQPIADPARQWRKLELKRYPNADAVLLDDLEQTAYNPDGTYSTTDESWILIVTEKGRKEHRTLSLHFNSFYRQRPQIDIEIIKPDGRVIKPDLRKNITIDSSQMQSNIFDPANKILTVGIPDVEVGDIIHSVYNVKAIKPRMRGVWCDWVNMQSIMPVLHYKYVISAPEKMPLKSIAVKDEIKNALTRKTYQKDGRIFYEFEAEDVPQFLPEVDMPPWYLHSMRVLTSTAENWQEVSRWYYNLCEDHLKAVSPELTAFARKLVAGKKGKAAIRAVFDYVSKEIRYTGITNENTAPGYEPHDVKETFAQKHGVCRDKAALLAAMLREVGFDAFMVLFMAGDPKDEEIPNYFFNHAITGVKMPDGELVLMDSTDENSSDLLPAYAMNKSFLCATKSGDILRRTPVVPPEKNMLYIKSKGAINEKFQLELSAEMTFTGINDNIYRDAFARWDNDYRKQFFASKLKRALPGAELTRLTVLPENVRDLSRPLRVVLECKVPDYVDINFGGGIVKTPFLSGEFGALSFMLGDKMLEKRKYPLQMFSTAGVEEDCSLRLPESLELTAMPDYKKVDNAVLKINTLLARKGNMLNMVRSIKLKSVEIKAAEYSQFRNAVLDISSVGQGSIIVKRNLNSKNIIESGVPAIIENSQYNIAVDEKKNVICRESKQIKILNYKGVKEYSELNLHFIEGISKSIFISASVTSPDGKVIKVDSTAAKIMDDGVAAGAPRYPAGKRVVLPLPGVKAGSVIEYATMTEYFADENFTVLAELYGKLPVKNAVVEFKYPAKLQKTVQLALPEAGFRIEKQRENGMIICKIFSRNIPAMPDEPGTPDKYLFAPYGGITLFNAANYGAKVRTAIEKAAQNAPECEKLAHLLTDNIPDKVEKIRAIRNYTAQTVRSAGYELDELGIKYITPADTTLRDNYGNSVDRAVLIYAMLKAAGITDVDIMLCSTKPYLPEYLTQFTRLPMNIFNRVILCVKLDGREFYLNDNNEYSPLEYAASNNCIALNTDNGELTVITSAPDCGNLTGKEWFIKILPDGKAEFQTAASYYGKNYAVFNEYFSNITPEKERQFWEQSFSGVIARAENKVITRDFKLYPGIIKMKFTVPDFWKKSGGYAVFTLPDSGVSNLVRTAGKRSLPYLFAPGSSMQIRYNVEIPENWQLCEFMGGSFNFNNLGNNSVVEQSANFTDKLLEVKVNFKVPDTLYIEPQSYILLEELQKKLSNPANRSFLFKTSGK